ncbi:Hypothetical protein NTJ_00249 [Nesidiocoris tenuis]|uniref:Uncharacterized protein n=1 Tax=Nesidiocoris tenuis TaxID=355587 RepID=A0ABN7A6B9_9HEMI|nr:Hypothetical protein NTJ_00249 [Nesidiocoris tenuis]
MSEEIRGRAEDRGRAEGSEMPRFYVYRPGGSFLRQPCGLAGLSISLPGDPHVFFGGSAAARNNNSNNVEDRVNLLSVNERK